MRDRLLRNSHLAVVLLSLAAFLLQVLLSSAHKTPVGDAPIHYRYGQIILGSELKPGEPPVWDGTAPVAALNVLAGGPSVPAPDFSVVQNRRQVMPNVIFGALLILGLWWWCRSFLGPRAASFAVVVAAMEPNLIGHSRFLTTDIPAAAGFFLGLASIMWFGRRPSVFTLIGSAVVVGLAQLTKVSNLLLFPAGAAAICAICLWEHRSIRQTLKLTAVWCVLAACTSLVFLNVAYQGLSPAVDQSILDPSLARLLKGHVPKEGSASARLLPLSYVATIDLARWHNQTGHPAYLLGEHRTHGWWYYFPVAILVKTPLSLLALALLGCIATVRERNLWLLVLVGCSGGYLLVFCLFANVDIGVRHVLSVFPALVALTGFAAARATERKRFGQIAVLGVALLLIWMAFESVRIAPHYEEYFNQLAGGSCSGWKVLGDSNIQWGQDGLFVKEWLARQRQPVSVNPTQPVKGLVVVRADFLVGHTRQMADAFAWLRDNHRPVDCITPGILVFHVE